MQQSTQYREIPLDQLSAGQHNPRRIRVRGARRNIQDLVPSVRRHGILEPLLVRASDEGYEILAGSRRFRAAKKVGLASAPCIVRTDDDHTARAVTIVENLHRQDLHPLQEAEGIARLLDEEGRTMQDVSAELGLPLSTVARRAKLRDLHPTFRKLFTADESPLASWSVRHLELCASYPLAIQEEIAKGMESDPWNPPETVADLRRELESGSLRIDNVPWKLDDPDLVPAAGPCSTCSARSGVERLLFEDLRRKDEAPRCLDPQCFESKRTAWLVGRVATAREEHGEALVLVSRRVHGPAEDLPSFGAPVRPIDGREMHSSQAKGRIPALVVDGYPGFDREFGQLVWLASEDIDPTAESSASKADVADQSVEAKLERTEALLRRKRLRHAASDLLEKAEGALLPSRIKLLRLAALFGGLTPRDHRYRSEADRLPEVLRTADIEKEPAPLWAAFEAASDDQAVCTIVWKAVQATLASRLDLSRSFDDFEAVDAEAWAYASLLGVSWDGLWKAARKACPPSKALCRRRDAVRASKVS